MVAGTPAGCVVGHDFTAPPPPPPTMGTPRGRGGGQGRGRASLADVFGSISAALVDAARADGTQGDPPPPRDREQQGAAGWLRDGQGRGASPPLSDRRQQAAAGQGLGQQGAAGQSVVLAQGQPGAAALGQGCQGAAGWPRDGQGRGASPPLSDQGQQVLQGRVWGRRLLQIFLWCRHRGSRRLLPWVRGVRDRARVRDRAVPLPPPARRSPPPLPPWAGRAGTGARQCDTRGQGSAWGRPPGAPRAAQGCGSPPAAPRGGALEPGLHPASAVIGRGGRPTPRSRTCICGRGWGRAQPEIWVGTLLRGSHIGRRPRSFRRAAIRWGGGGVRALYICMQLYIDELSAANLCTPQSH